MKKSTHIVEVVKLDPFKHPNADSLSIQKIHGYQAVLRTEDWEGVELGAYIVPDSVVDTSRPEFKWLKGPNFKPAEEGNEDLHRVTAMRLRGVISYGLMVPAPAGSKPGDDVSDILGVTRYQPLIIAEGAVPAPDGYRVDYDLEAFERYAGEIFQPEELVYCTEKLDGVNSRFCYDGKNFHVGSRTIWLEENKDSTWWKVLEQTEGLKDACAENQGVTIYGETIGFPKGLNTKRRYGIKPGELDFYIFDVLEGTSFLDFGKVQAFSDMFKMKTVPVLGILPYNFDEVMALADGPSLIAKNCGNREGAVIRAIEERRELAGRSILKLVSGRALMKS